MKSIKLRDLPGLKTVDIIRAVIERPSQGATISALRAGCRVLDALDKNTSAESLNLEDADHTVLVNAVNAFTFGMVSRDLLAVVDDVINAAMAPEVPTEG